MFAGIACCRSQSNLLKWDPALRILNRDLEFVGIDKQDADGRVVHIHALRHSFGTHLSKAGVAPRVAQVAIRHSNIGLTMSTCTDVRLLDVADVVERLHLFSESDNKFDSDAPDETLIEVPRSVAPNPAETCQIEPISDEFADMEPGDEDTTKPRKTQGL